MITNKKKNAEMVFSAAAKVTAPLLVLLAVWIVRCLEFEELVADRAPFSPVSAELCTKCDANIVGAA